jgi:PPOX class probable F420-dependent enzyme
LGSPIPRSKAASFGSYARGIEVRNLAELPSWAAGLLREEPVGRLGLLDSAGEPRVLPVTFAVSGGSVWSAVDDKPKRREGEELARVRWLRRRPRAALTVDRYSDDWSELAWVQVLGDVELVDPARGRDALAALAERYAAYRAQPPPGPLLELRPRRCLAWRAAG